MTPEEALLKAADDLAEHGGCKGVFIADREHPDTSPACAMGAIARATGQITLDGLVGPDVGQGEAVRMLAQQIRGGFFPVKPGHAFNIVASFNDSDTTTTEDVILAMKKAANHDC